MILILVLAIVGSALSIGIPLHEGPRCMIIQGEYDVIAT